MHDKHTSDSIKAVKQHKKTHAGMYNQHAHTETRPSSAWMFPPRCVVLGSAALAWGGEERFSFFSPQFFLCLNWKENEF